VTAASRTAPWYASARMNSAGSQMDKTASANPGAFQRRYFRVTIISAL
jgi:hypothetical protein